MVCSILAAFLPSFSGAPGAASLISGYIRRVLLLVRENYYRPVSTGNLLSGAVREMYPSCPVPGRNLLPSGDRKTITWQEFASVFSALEEEYPSEAGRLGEAAIRGIIESLDDPYSVFLDARDRKNFEKETSGGSFPGIGVELAMKGGSLLVVAAIRGTPASKAGIRPGDEIVSLENKSIKELGFTGAMGLMEGEAGTVLRLGLKRGGNLRTLRIRRESLFFPPPSFRMMKQGVGYIMIPLVDRLTEKQVMEGLNSLKKRGAEKFILDLRDNPGGDFEGGLRTASLFVPRGTLVRVMKNGSVKPFEARRPFGFGFPLAVLINGGTASAAEIIAAAISENGAGVLVGSRSFGKGLVQTVFSLTGGTAVKLTTASYLTPLGKDLNGVGLEPDIKVPDSNFPGEDNSLRRAWEHLQK